MPPRLGDSTGGASQQQGVPSYSNTGASQQQGAQQQRPPQAQAQHGHPRSSGRDDDAIDPSEAETGGGGSGSRKKWDEYAALVEGSYTFACAVNQVARWEWGTSVAFKVLLPGDEDHDGRQLEWGQTEPERMSADGRKYWRGDLIGAYAEGGWTIDPNPEANWNGWEPSRTAGSDGRPLPLPPYDRFFVWPVDRGLFVPTVVLVDVRVDAPPYDKYPKIKAVRPLLTAQGKRVQAPTPWRVLSWIADMYGWQADKPETPNRMTRPVVKLDNKQFERGAGGLVWWQEARDLIKSSTRLPRRQQVLANAGTDDIPF